MSNGVGKKLVRLTADQLAALASPKGWAFTRRPTLERPGSMYPEADTTYEYAKYQKACDELVAWAKKNKLGIQPGNKEWRYFAGSGGEKMIVVSYVVTANKPLVRKKYLEGGQCATFGCRGVVRFGMFTCKTCGGEQRCAHCGINGLTIVTHDEARRPICSACAIKCTHEGCKNWTVKGKAESPLCTLHDPVLACWGCGAAYRTSVMVEAPGREKLCRNCIRRYCLKHKDLTTTNNPESRGPWKKCPDCEFEEVSKKRREMETFKEEELPRGGSMLVPALPERPFRTVSVEMEYDAPRAANVASILWKEGLIESPHIGRYSSMGEVKSHYPCILKQDGSVTGGELVAYMLNLDDQTHADAFMRVLEVMNGLKAIGQVKFGINAGGHIHNDAHNLSVGDAFALVTLFNYLEDPIHRIAGAGEPKGHRSLAGNNHGTGGVTKGPFGGKKAFGMQMPRFARAALNIQHFVRAMQECRCGAANYEAWAECTCVLPKNTIEWRVFNATGSPRILHGWIAFIQSMIAFATAYEINEGDFPVFPWTRIQGVKYATDRKHIDATQERLRWIFTHLPLTADEKDSLLYCIKESDLAKFVDAEFLEGLPAQAPAVEFDMKPVPRNPNRRKVKIVKPDPTQVPKKVRRENPFR